MSYIDVQNIDIVFGSNPKSAFPMIDSGQARTQIREATQQMPAVIQASLGIEQGEIVVLMGLSGSGKSSLLRAINGLNKLSRGNIAFENQKITNFSNMRRQHSSMVFQNSALLPWRTVFHNIALGLEYRHLQQTEIARLTTQAIEQIGLSAWSNSLPKELSGGMQQRVGLARALATQAPILLMDEPFSALDPLIRSQLQQELLKLQKDLRKTILFVSHDLHEAMLLGNRIVIMHEGRIQQIGTPTQIREHPVNAHVERFVSMIRHDCPNCSSKSANWQQ